VVFLEDGDPDVRGGDHAREHLVRQPQGTVNSLRCRCPLPRLLAR
jgi:hypothetical protein